MNTKECVNCPVATDHSTAECPTGLSTYLKSRLEIHRMAKRALEDIERRHLSALVACGAALEVPNVGQLVISVGCGGGGGGGLDFYELARRSGGGGSGPKGIGRFIPRGI